VTYKHGNLLIIGGSSYVGRNLSHHLTDKYDIVSTFFSNKGVISCGEGVCLDVRDDTSVKRIIKTVRPSLIYILSYSLDDLEGTVVRGASHVMNAPESSKARVIYVSTDAVFGGKNRSYSEDDMPDYINEYGRDKYEAEKIVLNVGGFVVRTSLVYGFHPMDIRTSELLNDLRDGSTGTAYFSDEFRCPIYVNDLCYMLSELGNLDAPRILHMTGPGCISRKDFACKIAAAFSLNQEHIRTALLEGSGLARPQYLCLDSSLAQRIMNFRIRSVDEILETYASRGMNAGY
jgi:dTDP-4-dehydrorhamnose reductase